MSASARRRALDDVIELDLPARPEYLGVARMVVAAAAAAEPTFRPERIDDLKVAVSEAVTNAIEAHGREGVDDRVRLRCDLAGDRIEVEVVDRGAGFDPDAVSTAPSPEDPSRLEWERGMGLPLMRTLTDETVISSDEGGTTVRLVVHQTRRRAPDEPNGGTGDV